MKSKMHGDMENTHFFRKYLNDIARFPVLSQEEETALLLKVRQGNEKARKQLTCANLRFVIKISFMYKGRGLPVLDLINEGNIGLMKAVLKYDITKNVRFISCAVWWIRQAITQALFEKARMVRLSAANELIIRRIGRHAPRTRQVIGGEQSIDKQHLAERMGFSNKKMERLLEMNLRPVSLNAPAFLESDNFCLADRMINESAENPEEVAHSRFLHELIIKSLDSLGLKERKVITYSFGLGSNAVMNLRELSEMLGLSKERVRQIKEMALGKLKKIEKCREYLLAG